MVYGTKYILYGKKVNTKKTETIKLLPLSCQQGRDRTFTRWNRASNSLGLLPSRATNFRTCCCGAPFYPAGAPKCKHTLLCLA